MNLPLRLAAILLSPETERQLAHASERGEIAGAVLVPSARAQTDLRHAPDGRFLAWATAVEIASTEPAVIARAFASTGLQTLVADGETAAAVQPLVRYPVVTSIDGIPTANGVMLPRRANLIYHVCPLTRNDGWRQNLAELTRPGRLAVFNGRQVFAIATGDGCYPVATVRREIAAAAPKAEVIEVPNDPRLREVASFGQLLVAIESTSPAEMTFYGHTKGNSTADDASGAWLWSQAMYGSLLDQVEIVRELLRTFAAVGCCKMVWQPRSVPPYPSKLSVGNWMLAGTFFWFRHDRIFTLPNWATIADDRYAAEAWLSSLIPESEAASLYQPWPVDQFPTPNPYDPEVHRRVVAVHP